MHQYYRLGILLYLPPSQLEAWENDYHRNADAILQKILEFLFDNKENPLDILCSALTCIDQHHLAQQIRDKYEAPQGNATCLHFHFLSDLICLQL